MFTTGKRLDTAHLLTRRAHVDFDVGVEDIHGLAHFVHLFDKAHLGFAVQEQLTEHELEVLLNTRKRIEVTAAGNVVELGDGAIERGACAIQVVELRFHFQQALLFVFVVFHHVHVDGAQFLDLSAEFANFTVGFGLAVFHALDVVGVRKVHAVFVGDTFGEAVEVCLQGFLPAAHIVQFLHLLDHVVAEAVDFAAPFFEVARNKFVLFAGQVALVFQFAQG